MNTSQSVIVYLFAKGEPVKKAELLRYFGISADEAPPLFTDVQELLSKAGLTLIDDGAEVELRTAPESSELVEKIRKDEFSRDIGKAGIETLSIVLYRGPASRSEIDYVRGVNSAHILRSLSMRGLLRRVPHPKDERSFLYEPTTELLSHLGVSNVEELPGYEEVIAELSALEQAGQNAAAAESAEAQ